MSGSGSGQYPQIPSLTSLSFNPMASQQAQAPAYEVVNQFMKNWMQGGYPGAIPGGGTIPGVLPMPSVAPVSTGNAIYQAMLNPKPPVAPTAPTTTIPTSRSGWTDYSNPPSARGSYAGSPVTGPVPYIEMPSATQILPSARGSYPVPYPQMPAPANPVPYIEMPQAVQIPSIFTRTY